ncbi:MAG: hypothetical protein PHE83_16065 [Opitutaceae bacterium]|nr:hypothetical protein [Opitutaceae bacterium]
MKKLRDVFLTCVLWTALGLIGWNFFVLLVQPCRLGSGPYPPRVSPRGLSSNPGPWR